MEVRGGLRHAAAEPRTCSRMQCCSHLPICIPTVPCMMVVVAALGGRLP